MLWHRDRVSGSFKQDQQLWVCSRHVVHLDDVRPVYQLFELCNGKPVQLFKRRLRKFGFVNIILVV